MQEDVSQLHLQDELSHPCGVDSRCDLLKQHQHFTQGQSSPSSQQIDQWKSLEPFKDDKTDVPLSFNREEFDEIWMGAVFDPDRFFMDFCQNRRVGHKDPYGDAHPGQRIFRVENMARI